VNELLHQSIFLHNTPKKNHQSLSSLSRFSKTVGLKKLPFFPASALFAVQVFDVFISSSETRMSARFGDDSSSDGHRMCFTFPGPRIFRPIKKIPATTPTIATKTTTLTMTTVCVDIESLAGSPSFVALWSVSGKNIHFPQTLKYSFLNHLMFVPSSFQLSLLRLSSLLTLSCVVIKVKVQNWVVKFNSLSRN